MSVNNKKPIYDGHFTYIKSEDFKFAERGSHEWYLYHSFKNENALLPVIVFSILLLFIHNGIVFSIGLWIWYFDYCKRNNDALDKDPQILKKRERAIKVYQEQLETLKRMEKNANAGNQNK